MLVPQHFSVDHSGWYFCAKNLPIDKEDCHFSHSCISFLCAEHADTQIKVQFVFDESSLLKNTEKENYPIDRKASLRGRISPAVTFVRTSYKEDFLNKKAFLENKSLWSQSRLYFSFAIACCLWWYCIKVIVTKVPTKYMQLIPGENCGNSKLRIS